MTFLIEMLQKCNEIWNKVNNTMKKILDIEPVCNEKYLKTEQNKTL